VPQALPIGLDEATRLEGEDRSFSIRLDEAWEIWGPSGGYLAAIALRAAGRCAEIPRPASFYCHFLSAPSFDEVELVGLFHAGKLRLHELAIRAGWDSVHPRLGITKSFYGRFVPAISERDFALRPGPLDRALDFLAVLR